MTLEKLHLARRHSVSTKNPSRSYRLLCRQIIAGALGITALAGCGDIYRFATSREVGWALKKEIRDRRQNEFTLSSLTRFPWDELVIFSSYTPRNEICRRLQIGEPDCIAADLPEPLNDGLNLLVFRLNGKIVHRETQLGYHGEFRVEERSFTPRDAVFAVEPRGMLSNGQRQLILLWKAPSQPVIP